MLIGGIGRTTGSLVGCCVIALFKEAMLSCQVNVRLKPLGVDGGSNPGLLVRVLGGRALLSSELSAASHGGWFGPGGRISRRSAGLSLPELRCQERGSSGI